MKLSAKIFMMTLALLFLFSSVVLASDSTVKYIFYERTDGAVIVVDYEKAIIDIAIWHRRKLYDATVTAIQQALISNRKVWVEMKNGEVIDYRKAIADGKDFQDVLGNSDYLVARPKPDYEMYLTDFHEVALRYPKLDYPAWLNRNATQITWSELANRWIVDIFIIESKLPPGDYVYADIKYVLIKERMASRVEDEGRWRALLEGEKEFKPRIEPGDVRIRIGNDWFW